MKSNSLFFRLWWSWLSGSSHCWLCTWVSCCAWTHYSTNAGHSHPIKNTPMNMMRPPQWGVPRECLNACMCDPMCWAEWVTSRTSGSVRSKSSVTTYMINTQCWTECVLGFICFILFICFMSYSVVHVGFILVHDVYFLHDHIIQEYKIFTGSITIADVLLKYSMYGIQWHNLGVALTELGVP